jgi:protein-tyrosine-phosphatase
MSEKTRSEILETGNEQIKSARIVINAPAEKIFAVLANPHRHKEIDGSATIQAMQEVSIDISNNTPKVSTPEAVQESDAVITMGCGDACPFYPGKRYEDWVLDDPAGQGIESVRVIRDEIKKRVEQLLSELISQ